MNEIQLLFNQLTECGVEICAGNPVSNATVAELESLVGAPMPLSYRRFLTTFGYAGPFDCGGFLGLDQGDSMEERGVFAYTKDMASRHGFGQFYLVIYHNHDMETCWCIDLNSRTDDECPVVAIRLTPTGHAVTGSIASSFEEAVVLYLKESVNAEKEFGSREDCDSI